MMYQLHLTVLLVAVTTITGFTYRDLDTFEDIDREQRRSAAEPVGDIREQALVAHNAVRKNHVGTPPLKWDANLAAGAQIYALQIATSNQFAHSSSAQGENLYRGLGSSVKGIDHAAFLWYEEINRFDYNSLWRYNLWGAGSLGHFTQMVWVGTTHVGCAGASKSNGRDIYTYYVCRYSPAGNIPSKFDENVRPLKAGAAVPTSLEAFKVAEGCKDTNPSYCSRVSSDQCISPAFRQFNRATCPKTCGAC